MSKMKQERGSKVQAIRNEIAAGKDDANEIVVALLAKGIEVGKPSVYTALSKARAGKKRTGGSVGGNGAVSRANNQPTGKAAATSGAGLNVEDLQTLAMCATKLGGWNRLGQFIAAIS